VQTQGKTMIYNDDCLKVLPTIQDNSIDLVLTDPPYGSNVQYLELSHFWFPWNRDLYEIEDPAFDQEAISNRKILKTIPISNFSIKLVFSLLKKLIKYLDG
jgi:DNA modification methylase